MGPNSHGPIKIFKAFIFPIFDRTKLLPKFKSSFNTQISCGPVGDFVNATPLGCPKSINMHMNAHKKQEK